MRSHLFRWAVLVWAGIWIASSAGAQATDSSPSPKTSLADQLDQIGQKLFGGLRGPAKHQATQSPAPRPSTQPYGSGQYASPGAGNSLRADSQAVTPTNTGSSAATNPSHSYQHSPAAGTGTTLRIQQPTTTAAASPGITGVTNPAAVSRSPAPSATVSPPATTETSSISDADAPTVSSSMRLHERLSMFRQSAFDSSSSTTDGTASKSGGEPTPAATAQTTYPSESKPAVPQPAYARRFSRQPATGETTTPQPVSPQPTPAPQVTGTPTRAPARAFPSMLAQPERTQPTFAPRVAARSTLTQPSSVASPVAGEPDSNRAASSPTPAPSQNATASAAPNAEPSKPSANEANRGQSLMDEPDEALFVRQSPVLNVRTLGPRRILVGKESSYELIIRNSGQVAADEVIVTVALPEWADVAGAEASMGETSTPADSQATRQCLWKIARLEPKGQEKLVLRIVPRESKPFDLAVRWDYTPAVSQAMIEVQEPKLAMRLDGPKEVRFGQREVFRLELANTGTGDADAVEISLLPLGTGDNTPATHRIGKLPAGDKKVIEIELMARQSGTLTIKVDARGDGLVAASLAETITVLRAAINMAVDAPPMQFVGNEISYRIHLANSGTAPATNLKLVSRLPLGTKYVGSTDDGKLDAEGGSVTWTIANMAPGAEKTLELACRFERPGANRLEVAATADDELTASTETTTQVEAIADLRLDITDPGGPVAVGTNASYEIKVHNRGSKAAEEVEVVAYFSRGIEPVSVEGGSHKTASGQVAFDKIPSLAPGESVVLKIKARAEMAGNHVFRAEVYCRPLGSRLVSEQTTHYYGNPGVATRRESPQSGDPVPPSKPNGNTATRRSLFDPLK